LRKHSYYKEAFFKHRDGREVCNDTAAGKRDYTGRTVEMWERQDGKCAICGHWIELRYATFDHEEPRGMGGGSRDDRTVVNGEWHNAAAHGICNTRKGSKRYRWVNGKYVPVNKSQEVLTQEVA
jgi:hypothetical protein